MVSGYANVFILLFNVIGTLPYSVHAYSYTQDWYAY